MRRGDVDSAGRSRDGKLERHRVVGPVTSGVEARRSVRASSLARFWIAAPP